MKDELLTAAEIARRAGVHRSTVGDWIDNQKLTPASTLVRGSTKQKLFRLSDAQPLIDRALEKQVATDSEVPAAPPSV